MSRGIVVCRIGPAWESPLNLPISLLAQGIEDDSGSERKELCILGFGVLCIILVGDSAEVEL